MNLLRNFFALGLVALFVSLGHASDLSFEAADFSAAQEITQNGKILVSAKLSPAGDAKMTLFNRQVGQEIELHLGGESQKLKLREAIHDGQLQMGPFSAQTAKKIIHEINTQL